MKMIFVMPVFFLLYGAEAQISPIAKGIYLENLNVTIPWKYDFSDLPDLGNPKIVLFRKKNIDIIWDSVKIWNGKMAKITKRTPRKRMSIGNPLVITFYNEHFDTIKAFLDDYTGIMPVSNSSRNGRAQTRGWKLHLFQVSLHRHPKINGFEVYIYYKGEKTGLKKTT